MTGQPIFKLLIGTIAGLIVAVLTVGIVEWIGHAIFPPPPGIDLSDPSAMTTIIDNLPPGALSFVLLAWFAGSLLGGLVAGLISRSRTAPWTVSGFILVGGIYSFSIIPHPMWMMAGGVALPIFAALLVLRRMPK